MPSFKGLTKVRNSLNKSIRKVAPVTAGAKPIRKMFKKTAKAIRKTGPSKPGLWM